MSGFQIDKSAPILKTELSKIINIYSNQAQLDWVTKSQNSQGRYLSNISTNRIYQFLSGVQLA